MTIALASILFAFAFTPAVVELLGLYYGKSLSANVSGAVGASLAITAEPIIRHMYALAANPAAILGVVKGLKRSCKSFSASEIKRIARTA
ncbi:hypothetical protein FLP41_15240 [Paracoccus marcusii]|uniref:hypothetical protein n=1 Tax=Paracoccus marcusii TaxID=59779 RepID=UPI0012F44D98|nr:hypothetical protein FLP41_15240 [Paracoccus marcusii]